MENLLGLLRLRVRRGINLAIRDTRSSDPYVVVTMAGQVCLLSSLPLHSFSFVINLPFGALLLRFSMFILHLYFV